MLSTAGGGSRSSSISSTTQPSQGDEQLSQAVALVAVLGTVGQDEGGGLAADAPGQLVDELQRTGVGPLDVVDEDDGRDLRRHPFEEPGDRLEQQRPLQGRIAQWRGRNQPDRARPVDEVPDLTAAAVGPDRRDLDPPGGRPAQALGQLAGQLIVGRDSDLAGREAESLDRLDAALRLAAERGDDAEPQCRHGWAACYGRGAGPVNRVSAQR